ncbi:hypothetical protein [Christiangramia sabulilitoris]|uniref:Fibronectin type-III domain-containing protein n=1 Tax=Christiangramia sabulilitoris TaxID=2583991 RepID=A0A550I2X7_9FLAO|nr:hypothetical protein [Christiangramia sabulilitoris]TRO65309.1 hypothetical protein FGM01_07835 [Christiangramia sabulilitoris]
MKFFQHNRILFTFIILGCTTNDNSTSNSISTNSAPASFDLKGISDNQSEVSVNPTFSWTSATDPDGDEVTYDLYVGIMNEELQKIASNLSEEEYKVTDRLFLLTSYKWKVVAKDSQGAETTSDIINFTTRNLKDAQLIRESPFPDRVTHSVSVFDSKIWVAGGQMPESERLGEEWIRDDVWVSTNGTEWVEKENLPIPMESQISNVFQDKLWIIGEKIYNTIDGLSWNEVNTNSSFPGFSYIHTSEVFKDKMWVMGWTPDAVYNSSNGIAWMKVIDGLDFLNFRSKAIVFNDRLLLISNTRPLTIRQMEENGEWSILEHTTPVPRHIAEFLVFNGKIWGFGKSFEPGNESLYQIWTSEDAITWNLVKEDPNLDVYGPLAMLEGKIYIIGSRWQSNTFNYSSEIWLIE